MTMTVERERSTLLDLGRLKPLRERAGFDYHGGLTRAAELVTGMVGRPITAQMINNYESQRHEPKPDVLHAMLKVYGATMSSLERG